MRPYHRRCIVRPFISTSRRGEKPEADADIAQPPARARRRMAVIGELMAASTRRALHEKIAAWAADALRRMLAAFYNARRH